MRRSAGVRQSVSLPSVVAKRVRAIAKRRKVSANRVLVDLIETGLQAKETQKERFLALARRFKESTAPVESERLREQLAQRIFGREPSKRSLREIPEVDLGKVRVKRNRYARRTTQ